MDQHKPFDIEAACSEADARLRNSLNRSVGQHLMHLRRHAAAMVFERGARPDDFTLVPITVEDFYPRAAS